MSDVPWSSVITLLNQQPNSEGITDVLHVLLTKEERRDIATRLAILKAIHAGDESQRHIARRLQVSIAKVIRGANYYKQLSETERTLLNHTSSS